LQINTTTTHQAHPVTHIGPQESFVFFPIIFLLCIGGTKPYQNKDRQKETNKKQTRKERKNSKRNNDRATGKMEQMNEWMNEWMKERKKELKKEETKQNKARKERKLLHPTNKEQWTWIQYRTIFWAMRKTCRLCCACCILTQNTKDDSLFPLGFPFFFFPVVLGRTELYLRRQGNEDCGCSSILDFADGRLPSFFFMLGRLGLPFVLGRALRQWGVISLQIWEDKQIP
jgi:hypothetical protein